MLKAWFSAPLFLVILSSCQEPAVETISPAPIRAVKLFTVSAENGSSERSFSGTTVASSYSSLSFPLSGKVTEILSHEGQEVSKNQILAKLDSTSFVREQKMASAERRQARVTFEEKKSDFNRKKPLGDSGVITQSELEMAKAAMLSAQAQLHLSETKVKLADDSVEDTTLRSPFDGVISERSTEPFVEVVAGQQIFMLENQGEIEVEIAVPESIISKIELGQTTRVSFKSTKNTLLGKITEIAASADVGNVFTVKITLEDTNTPMYSGLSAEVTLKLTNSRNDSGILVPLSSIVAGNAEHDYVYVFQEETNTVNKIAVTHTSDAFGNHISVNGISAGDRVVSAGVAFLSDGLNVKPFVPAK